MGSNNKSRRGRAIRAGNLVRDGKIRNGIQECLRHPSQKAPAGEKQGRSRPPGKRKLCIDIRGRTVSPTGGFPGSCKEKNTRNEDIPSGPHGDGGREGKRGGGGGGEPRRRTGKGITSEAEDQLVVRGRPHDKGGEQKKGEGLCLKESRKFSL